MFLPAVGKDVKDIRADEDHGMRGHSPNPPASRLSTCSEISLCPLPADPDERRKLAYLLARSCFGADERAEQFQGMRSLFLAESADEQLQSLPYCHAPGLPSRLGARPCRTAACQRPSSVLIRISDKGARLRNRCRHGELDCAAGRAAAPAAAAAGARRGEDLGPVPVQRRRHVRRPGALAWYAVRAAGRLRISGGN